MMNRLSDEWFSSKSESVPLWHKIALSIDEMYVYTGIGRETYKATGSKTIYIENWEKNSN